MLPHFKRNQCPTSTGIRIESSIDSLERILFVFTGLVFVGLVIEYWHDIKDFIEEVRRQAAIFPWKKFMELSGGIIVTIGVAGELFTQSCVSQKESNLRSASHQLEGILNAEADNAKERTAKLEIELFNATFQRRLDAIQQGRVATALRPFTGQRFNLFGYSSDPEVVQLANDFLGACCDHGAKWKGSLSDMPVGTLVGVLVLIKPDSEKRAKNAARALASALHSEKIAVVGPLESSDHKAAIGGTIRDGVFDIANPITVVIGKKR